MWNEKNSLKACFGFRIFAVHDLCPLVFSLHKHSLFYGQKLLTSSDWSSGNCLIEFNNKHGFIKQPFTFVLQNMFLKILQNLHENN